VARLLYVDQNQLGGIAKRKPALLELDTAPRAALARGAVVVVGSGRARAGVLHLADRLRRLGT
jgi:hypothetical protein